MTVDVRVLLLLLLLKQTAIATRDFTDNNKTQKNYGQTHDAQKRALAFKPAYATLHKRDSVNHNAPY